MTSFSVYFCSTLIPRHPSRWLGCQVRGTFLQLSEVVKRIGAGKFTGMDQTHEQIAGFGAVQRAIKQRVLAMQHRPFQRTFAEIVIQGCAGFPQKRRQPFPVA